MKLYIIQKSDISMYQAIEANTSPQNDARALAIDMIARLER